MGGAVICIRLWLLEIELQGQVGFNFSITVTTASLWSRPSRISGAGGGLVWALEVGDRLTEVSVSGIYNDVLSLIEG